MSDNINAGMNLNPEGWTRGLENAQQSAVKFIAFLAKLEGVFKGVSDKSLTVAQGIAQIGGVSAAVKEEMELLHSGTIDVGKMMNSLKGAGVALESTVKSILTGNQSLEQSLDALGVKWNRETKKLEMNIEAKERMLAIMAKMRASEARGLVDASGTPIPGRSKSAAVFQSTDPMSYSSPTEIAIARKIQKIEALARKNNLKANLPSIEMGDDKTRLNMARLAMAYDNIKQQIVKVGSAEDDLSRKRREADADFSRRLRAAIAMREKEHAVIRKLQLAEERRHRADTFAELGQMYGKGPNKSRLAELAQLGVVSQNAGQKGGNAFQMMFKKFEKGSSLAVKGTMSLVRGLNSAQSAVAFMTSGFAGLVAMISGASAGALFKFAMDFEKASLRINQLTGDDRSGAVKDLSRKFGFSPGESAEGFRRAAGTEVPKSELNKFMAEAGKLAVASQAPIEKTADMLARLRIAFKLTTDDMPRIRDMIFVMTKRGSVEVDQFADQIGKIAPTARLAGANIQEMFAAFSALSQVRSVDEAGTLLRNLFKNIIEDSKDSETQAMKLRIGMTASGVHALGLMKVMANFREEVQQHPKALTAVAEDLRELSALGDLTDAQFEVLTGSMDEMTRSVGEGDRQLQKMMDSSFMRFERLTAQMKISAIELGQSLLRMFDSWVQGSGGMEVVQKKVEYFFQRLELIVRNFVAVFQTLAELIVAPFTLMTRAADKMVSAGLVKKQLQEERLAEEAAARGDTEAELRYRRRADSRLRQREALDKEKGLDEWWKPNSVGLSDNISRIAELSTSLAGQDQVIKQISEDWQVQNAYIKAQNELLLKGNQIKKESDRINPVRDQASATREWLIEALSQQVHRGEDILKQWVQDNRDNVGEIVKSYKDLAKEQVSAVKEMQKSLKNLDKDQKDFGDTLEERFQKLRDQDRTPTEMIESRIRRGHGLEREANQAAKAGNVSLVEEKLKGALDLYESILDVEGGNTKDNRSRVIGAMRRLKGDMDTVYAAERDAIQAKLAAAEELVLSFTSKAEEVELKFKTFQQGIRDLGRAMDELGNITKNSQSLMTVKDMILSLFNDSQYFLNVATDPALAAIDKVIEKVATLKSDLGAVPVDLLNRLSGKDLAGVQLGTTPMSPARNTTNNTSNITNVDAVHVNVPGGDGGPKKADARRLAREIRRNIQRGESAPLNGR